MLIAIPKLLDAQQVNAVRQLLDQAGPAWVDGRVTAGYQGAAVKYNQQIDERSDVAVQCQRIILSALERNPRFISAALPNMVYPPMFNRYSEGMTFGAHVDGSVRIDPHTGRKLRTAFLTEYAPVKERAFYSSWIQASIGVAVLLGAAVGTFVTSSLSPEALASWGWRLPFLLGIIIGPVGYYIRHHLDETPTFLEAKDKTDSPLKEIISNFPRETLASFSMVILWTVCTYVLLFYMPTYSIKVLKLPQSTGFIAGMVGGLCIMVFAPIVGRIADRFGRRGLLSGAALLILLLAYPMFAYINAAPGLFSLLIFQLVFGILIATYTGPILAAFSELFPAKVLSTGLSVAYNLAVTIFGGFASFFITWLIAATGSTMAPAFYVMIAAAISLVGTRFVREPSYLQQA